MKKRLHGVQFSPMKGFIFDCDGTLIDSEYTHFLSWQEPLQKRGGSLREEEYHFLAGKPGTWIAQKLYEQVRQDSPEMIAEEKRQSYLQLIKKGLPAIERTVQFVRELAAQKEKLGIKLAVASASHKQEILLHLDHLGITDLFEAIVSGHDDLGHYNDPEGTNKPKPYIYLHAAQLLGIDPKDCIAFEDTYTGLQAAVSAGMKAVAVPNSFTFHQDFSQATLRIEPEARIILSEFLQKMFSL